MRITALQANSAMERGLDAASQHSPPILSKTVTMNVTDVALAFGVLLDDLVAHCGNGDGVPKVMVVSTADRRKLDTLKAFEKGKAGSFKPTSSWAGECWFCGWWSGVPLVACDGLIEGRLLVVGPSRAFSADLIVRQLQVTDE